MYVCHHCGFISRNENVNYCNNVNCKYYGHSGPNKPPEQKSHSFDMNEGKTLKRSLMKTDSMTFVYDGDINYPSDKLMKNDMDGNNGYGNYNNGNNMEYKNPTVNMDYGKGVNNVGMNNMGMSDMNMNNMSARNMGMGNMEYKNLMDVADRSKPMNNMDTRMDYGNRTEMKDIKMENSCGSLAFATVPMQKCENLYPLKEAMKTGTIFPSLNMPYDKKIIWRG